MRGYVSHTMENLIYAVVRALGTKGVTVKAIHDACIKKNWSEEDIFLAIRAGQNLYHAIQKQEHELRNRKPIRS